MLIKYIAIVSLQIDYAFEHVLKRIKDGYVEVMESGMMSVY